MKLIEGVKFIGEIKDFATVGSGFDKKMFFIMKDGAPMICDKNGLRELKPDFSSPKIPVNSNSLQSNTSNV